MKRKCNLYYICMKILNQIFDKKPPEIPAALFCYWIQQFG